MLLKASQLAPIVCQVRIGECSANGARQLHIGDQPGYRPGERKLIALERTGTILRASEQVVTR
mgnify:CR=1 FL=1